MARSLGAIVVLVFCGISLSASAAEFSSTSEPFKDCSICPTMMALPAGRFIMGADDERNTYGPAHDRVVARPFAIAVTETTFDQYEACVAAGVCRGDKSDHGWGRGVQPVINVSWQDTRDYAAWLLALTGVIYRLPTEAEWEYAARAGSVSRFPWGETVGEGNANCRNCGTPWSGKGAAPVAQFPPNEFGLYDMMGNVSEWVADCWRERHDPDAETGPVGTPADNTCPAHVTRGGDWYYVPMLSTSVARKSNAAKLWSYTIGFRVVRELD